MPPTPKAKNIGPLTPLKVVPTTNQLCSIRLSADGKVLAGGTFEGSVRRWDPSTDKFEEMPSITGLQGWVQHVAFHPDSKRLFAADSFGTVGAWPATEPAPKALWTVPAAHDGWIQSLAISPDGATLATGGRDRNVHLTNTADGKKRTTLPHPEPVMTLAFTPNSKSLVSGDFMGVVREWDLATGKQVRELDAKAMHIKYGIQDVGGVRCFAFDAKGETLVAGGSAPATGGFVTGTTLMIAFDWKTGKAKQSFKGTGDKDGYVYDMAFHPEGYVIAVSSGQPGSGKVMLQKLDEAQPFTVAPLPNCHSLVITPDGKRLVVAATNANSSGNGRPKGDNYPGNFSPLHIFEIATKG